MGEHLVPLQVYFNVDRALKTLCVPTKRGGLRDSFTHYATIGQPRWAGDHNDKLGTLFRTYLSETIVKPFRALLAYLRSEGSL